MSSALAFITGGSEGIGKEIAREMIKSGMDVVVLSRSKEKLQQTASELNLERQSATQKIEWQSLDVTDWEQTESVVNGLVEKYGTPDYLINCAGFARPGFIEELEIQHFRQMMDSNYFGILHMCKALVPYFIKSKKGKIINTSSMAGFIGLFGYTGYCASKWAVMGFSEALRRELEPYGVRVSVLAPPNTSTPGLAEENKYKAREILATEEKAKPLSPQSVAKAVISNLNNNKFVIHPNFDGALAHSLSRFAPSVLNLFVRRKP